MQMDRETRCNLEISIFSQFCCQYPLINYLDPDYCGGAPYADQYHSSSGAHGGAPGGYFCHHHQTTSCDSETSYNQNIGSFH